MTDARVTRLCNDIRAAQDEVMAVVTTLTPEQLAKPSINPGWSAQDVLVHIATIPLRNLEMWHCVMEGREWTGLKSVIPWNEEMVAARRGKPASDIIAEYKKNVGALLDFLEHAPEGALDKEWDHPAASIGHTTLEVMANAGPRHHRKHLAEIVTAANS
ncbi:MAG: maleylpyruvate isomerase N-terminal domain-containing protein [Chloroflexota bacterium]